MTVYSYQHTHVHACITIVEVVHTFIGGEWSMDL